MARVRALDCMAVSIVELQYEFRNQNLLRCPQRTAHSTGSAILARHIDRRVIAEQFSIHHALVHRHGRQGTNVTSPISLSSMA
jgi:hypothetical protein